jgi:hypothetical protein
VGHAFINPKDIPFSTGYIWALYFIVKLFREMPVPPAKLWLMLGLCIGFSCGVRMGGIILLLYFMIAFFILILYVRYASGFLLNSEKILGQKNLVGFFLMLIVAYTVTIVFWPAALLDPLVFPLDALNKMQNFTDYKNPVFYLGEHFSADELPWHYLIVYMGIKLPIGFLLFFTLGVVLVLRQCRSIVNNELPWPQIVLLVGIFIPVLYVIFRTPIIYDEMRHFIFLLPPMAVLAGLAAGHVLEINGHARIFLRQAFVGVIIFTQVLAVYAYHPYQYTYYNGFIGGLKGAYGKYEIDYWGTSIRELIRNYEASLTDQNNKDKKPLTSVHVCGPLDVVLYYTDYSIEIVDMEDALEADHYIALSRYNCIEQRPKNSKLQEKIELHGVPLSTLYQIQ